MIPDDGGAYEGPPVAVALARCLGVPAAGLREGADADELVRPAARRLRAVVLPGSDRGPLVDALRRHAPHLPVAGVDRLDTGAMSDAVHRARALSRAGDTVLLAPAADLDRRDGSELGALFRTAVARLAAGAGA